MLQLQAQAQAQLHGSKASKLITPISHFPSKASIFLPLGSRHLQVLTSSSSSSTPPSIPIRYITHVLLIPHQPFIYLFSLDSFLFLFLQNQWLFCWSCLFLQKEKEKMIFNFLVSLFLHDVVGWWMVMVPWGLQCIMSLILYSCVVHPLKYLMANGPMHFYMNFLGC